MNIGKWTFTGTLIVALTIGLFSGNMWRRSQVINEIPAIKAEAYILAQEKFQSELEAEYIKGHAFMLNGIKYLPLGAKKVAIRPYRGYQIAGSPEKVKNWLAKRMEL